MNCYRFLKLRSFANYGADYFITLSKNYIKKGNLQAVKIEIKEMNK